MAVEKMRESKLESRSKRELRSRISERQLLHGRLADCHTEKHTGKRREMGATIALPSKRPDVGYLYADQGEDTRQVFLCQKGVSSGER